MADCRVPKGTCRCLWWACECLGGLPRIITNPLPVLQAAEQVFPDSPMTVTYSNLFRSVIKTGRQWQGCWFCCFLAVARQAPLVAVGFWWFPLCSDSLGRNMHMGDLFVGVLFLGWLVLLRCYSGPVIQRLLLPLSDPCILHAEMSFAVSFVM